MTLNKGFAYREAIGAQAAGRSIVEYLAATRGHSTVTEWSARILRGEVEIDGTRALAHDRLRPGQVVVWHRPPWHETDVPLHFDVVHEDAVLLAVVKPAGLPTLPAGGFLEHTLLAIVRERFPDANPVHRLGRHTSGLVLFARTRECAATLQRAWPGPEVTRRYRALVSGHPRWEQQVIAVAIGPVFHPRLGSVHAASPSGRQASSVARVLERRDSGTLVEIDIATGRPHQIRIHMAAVGHPLVGDALYVAGGVPRGDNPALPGDGGYHLHAEGLRFPHPTTGARMDLHARVPRLLDRTPDRSLHF